MPTSPLVYTINCASLMLSVAQFCVASSIFDFIVVNRLYYAANDEAPLIDPKYAIIYFIFPLLSSAISLWTLTVPNMPRSIQAFISRHPFSVAVAHGTLLGAASIAFAFCSLTSAQLSLSVGYHAYKGVPLQFEGSSVWYLNRLRSSTVLFGLQSILTLSQIGLLYMGLKCRYTMIEPHSIEKEHTMKSQFRKNP
ncbi:hypothetical protein PRIPAC_81079 [Pristionchus pacificus]|uniref:Uncharacterized protein n=1 Tax=Pristionchus pacificus TaxID=54126 RepID=A0A2A6CQ95_PRIPA|nr:hypothetical protein PRIPAC_81079 [Pristionchus pacificus]|eukprot:PDM80385.1 hypothetical protein PRIPAC_32964 [Pristionchus pacificus]